MRWKFEIENISLDAPREVKHYSGKDLKLTWTKEDDRKYDFKQEIDDITFLKVDFEYFFSLEQSDIRCELQTLKVYLVCGGVDELKYTGTFSMSSGKWNLDKCLVKFKINTLDAYTCLEEKQEDVNIFDFNLEKQSAHFGFEYGYDSLKCSGLSECLLREGIGREGLYNIVLENYVGFHLGYLWHYIIADCDYNPGPDWEVVENCSNGKIKYQKPIEEQFSPEVDRNKTEEDIAYFNENFDFVVNFQPKTSLDNGMKLLDVLQNLLNGICDGYTITSDFFQWNAKNITDINYVTNEDNWYANLLIFQKSDVKRPDSINNATKAEINFKTLFEELLITFNCGYKIIDNELIIEHISWFESGFGMNLQLIDNKNQFLKGTRKYSYDANKLPKIETFSFMESGSDDFKGLDIIYDSDCVNNDDENKPNNEVKNITTDVFYCLENSTSDNENVSDNGFVLIACDKENKIISTPGLLSSDYLPNNVLGWAHLHDKLWKHGRVLKAGIMNGDLIDFKSIEPSIKQDKFGMVLNCSHIIDFKAIDKVKSTLGWGFVESAELILSKCVMSFDLVLDEILLGKDIETFGDFDDDFSEEFD